MHKPKVLRSEVTVLAYVLDKSFASELRAFGISSEVIDSLDAAMRSMTNVMDETGYGYARDMRQALLDYGLRGVQQQTDCMLSRMRKWRGNEARHHKNVLRKWIEK